MAKKSLKTSKKLAAFNIKFTKNVQMLLVGLLVGISGTALTYTSFAAPSGKGGGYSGTISGPVMIDDKNGDGLANWNDTITFNVESNYTANTSGPWASLVCYQNGQFIYSQSVGFGPTYPWSQDFTLNSAYWTNGGGADCTATLYYSAKNGRQVDMAKMAFKVNP